jgi:microcystin-dependent protein
VTTASGSTADAPADKLNTSFSFEVVFQNSGAAYTDAVAWTKSDNTTGSFTPDTTGKVTFNLTGGQTITMTLPKGVTYTVSETNIPTDFTLASTTGSTSGTIAAGQDMTVTFTNQFADKIDLVGTKTWVGDDVNTRPSTITLQLWKHLDGTADTEDVLVVRGDFKGSFTASANTSGVWTYRFSGMPKYEGGKLITYYVTEPTVPDGYTCEVNGMDVTNTYVPKDYSLTLTKEVSGKFADTTKAFDFTITLKDKDGQAVTDSFDVETSTGVTASTIADGKIKFTDGTTTVALAHGQTIKIKNLKEGYTYEIQEQLGSDTLYTPSAKVEYTDSTGAATSQTMTTLSNGSIGTRTLGSNETVTYTNTRETMVPTGVRTENKPFVMIGVLALLLVGAAVVFYGTRRKAIKNFKNR